MPGRMSSLVCGAALLLFGCACTDPVPPNPGPDTLGTRAYEHVETLVGYGPRHVGSLGWEKAVKYIAGQLTEMGLQPRLDVWFDDKEKLTFTNISVTLPGESKDKIVIGCHHDTKKCLGHPDPAHNFHFVGANDSGSGVGLLIELARSLKDKKRKATYEIVFFDGEESLPWEWDKDRALFGSRRYVRHYVQGRLDDPTQPKIEAFILLDMVGAKDLQIDEEENSDKELREIVFQAAQEAGYDSYFFQNALPVTDDHIPFVEENIRAVDLIDIHTNDEWHTKDDTLEHIAPGSLHIVGGVVLRALPMIEQKYFAKKKE